MGPHDFENDDSEPCGRTAHLQRRAAEKPDNDAADDAGDEPLFRRYARGNGNSHAQRQCNEEDDDGRRQVGTQEVIKFRVATNSRPRTADGGWEPGNSLFINVNCWGKLVTGVGAALGKGDPVVVVGYVYTSEYDDKEGNKRYITEIIAQRVQFLGGGGGGGGRGGESRGGGVSEEPPGAPGAPEDDDIPF